MPRHRKQRKPAVKANENARTRRTLLVVPFRNDQPGDPAQTFLALTSQTCPYPNELERFGEMLHEMGFEVDELGNGRLEIPRPDGSPSTTGFCAHMDDVSVEVSAVRHHLTFGEEGERLVSNAAREPEILGADNKAGMTVLLHLINARVPGRYMLFVGEELGRIGSEQVAAKWSKGLERVIAFDRSGLHDIITFQMGQRCASDEFAAALGSALEAGGLSEMRANPGGLYTDTASFMPYVPECTNVAVGFDSAHTSDETQDLSYLEALCRACVQVDWENLPTLRDPRTVEEHQLEQPVNLLGNLVDTLKICLGLMQRSGADMSAENAAQRACVPWNINNDFELAAVATACFGHNPTRKGEVDKIMEYVAKDSQYVRQKLGEVMVKDAAGCAAGLENMLAGLDIALSLKPDLIIELNKKPGQASNEPVATGAQQEPPHTGVVEAASS